MVPTTTTTTLVVGANGATGKYVAHLLLQQGHYVKGIVRSKEAMMNVLQELHPSEANDDNKKDDYFQRLTVIEASLLDMPPNELQNLVQGCDAVVSCLGHNGIWGHPRRLVCMAVERLCQAILAAHAADSTTTTNNNNNKVATKFILMGSNGVANPNGQDPVRSWSDRMLLFLIRYLVAPHADNEAAAAYVHGLKETPSLEWTVVRPVNLINGPVTEYELSPVTRGSLFGGGLATRANVAKCMVDLILNDNLWTTWKFQMPVIRNPDAVGNEEESNKKDQ